MKRFDKFIVIGILGIIMIIIYVVISFIKIDSEGEEGLISKNYNNYSIFYTLFKNLGYKVTRRYTSRAPEKSSVILLFEYIDDNQKFLDTLMPYIEDGGILFIIGVNSDRDPIEEYELKEGNIGTITIYSDLDRDVKRIAIGKGRYFSDHPEDRILLSSSKGPLLYKKRYKRGSIYVLSDSSLFTNRRIIDESVAILINNLFRPYYRKEIHLIQRNIYSTSTSLPVMALFKGKMFYVTLQLLLIGFLFIIKKGIHFGHPVRYNPYYRRSLTEHIQAVENLFRKSGSVVAVANINSQYFLHKIKKYFNIRKKISDDSLLDLLSRKINIDKNELIYLSREITSSSDSQAFANEKNRERVINQLKK